MTYFHSAILQLYQHFYEQSCEFTSADADSVARENMTSVKVDCLHCHLS